MKGKVDKEQVKKVIRALLVSAPHGLTVSELCTEYAAIEFTPIPYRELGYKSAVDLVKDMPDVVRPVFYGTAMILRGVVDASTAHIKELVRHQRSTGRNSKIVSQESMKNPVDIIIPTFLQKRIANILVDFPKGLLVSSFCNIYVQRHSVTLDPKRLGLKTVAQILMNCPDILYLKPDKNLNEVWVYPSTELLPSVTYKSKPAVQNRASLVPKKTEDEIVDLLLRNYCGIWSAQFSKEFKLLYKRELNFQRLGFGSVIELMADIGERVQIERPIPVGDWLLKAKVNVQPAFDVITDSQYKYSLQSPGDLDQLIEIYLSYIIDPTNFWFQCVSSLDNLSSLMGSLSEFYTEKFDDQSYFFPEEFLRHGQTCCALYEDGEWYRTVITNITTIDNIEVFYVDYGNVGTVSLSDLRLLKKDFLSLPAQAFPAKLSNVRPNEKGWTKECNSRFFEVTSDRHLYGKIISYEQGESPENQLYTKQAVITCLELTNTNYEHDLLVNKILVAEGHARQSAYNKDSARALEAFYEDYYETLKKVSLMTQLVCDVQNTSRQSEKRKPINQPPKDLVNSTTTQLENELNNDIVDERGVSKEETSKHTNKQEYPIKIIHVEKEGKIHLIMYENDAYIVSSEISPLFWAGDILKHMLRRSNVKIPFVVLLRDDHPDIFNVMRRYKVKGICTAQGDVKPGVTLYNFQSLMDICNIFTLTFQENIDILKEEFETFNDTPIKNYFKQQQKVPIENLEEMLKLHYQALNFKKKRIYLSMMSNRADETAVDEIKSIEDQMKTIEIKLNELKTT